MNINRRKFSATAAAIALAGTSERTGIAATNPQASVTDSPKVDLPRVELPRGRVPLSFIIDDSTCLVNIGWEGYLFWLAMPLKTIDSIIRSWDCGG